MINTRPVHLPHAGWSAFTSGTIILASCTLTCLGWLSVALAPVSLLFPHFADPTLSEAAPTTAFASFLLHALTPLLHFLTHLPLVHAWFEHALASPAFGLLGGGLLTYLGLALLFYTDSTPAPEDPM